MNKLMLVTPSSLYAEQVMSYKEEMIKNGDSFDGCAGLEEVTSFEEWLNFEERLKRGTEIYHTLKKVLKEKGYNPVNQIVGYIMSGDPTYITSHKGARSLIMKVERDEILEELMAVYIDARLK